MLRTSLDQMVRQRTRVNAAVVGLGSRINGTAERPELTATPLLAALREAGTRHVYADTADVEELAALVARTGSALRAEVDGNTVNQPLLRKVVSRVLDAGDPRGWARDLRERAGALPDAQMLPLLYAIVCGRIGNDMVRSFGAGRPWEVSLQLHMTLLSDQDAARRVGRLLRLMVPGCFVKVPFTPDHPHCLLLARDLEREGVPVNITSTFSARQVVAGALLANVTRTNVFLGRLSQGMQTDLLGEHVTLEAQRALLDLRRKDKVVTRLIVASLRDWRTFVRVAGCDVFTAPCKVLESFLEQNELAPDAVQCRLEHDYESRLQPPEDVQQRWGAEGLARLWRVEPEYVEFLRELRVSREFREMHDGAALAARFEQAGFGDVFHSPDKAEAAELRGGKLPVFDGVLAGRVALDTHYSLLANADFVRHQEAIDEMLAVRAGL